MRTWMTMVFLIMVGCGDGGDSPGPGAPVDRDASDEDASDMLDEVSDPPDFVRNTPPICGTADAPRRCATEPADHEWGEAMIVTGLWLEGTADEPICCADTNGDSEIDNSLGQNAAGFGHASAINGGTNARLARGDDAVVLEFGDLDKPRVAAQWWRARWTSAMESLGHGAAHAVLVTDIDDGTQSRSTLAPLEASGEQLVTRAGRVKLPMVVFDAPTWMPAHVVEFSLVRELRPGSGDREWYGELGAVIEVRDFLGAMNTAVDDCDCLGLGAEQLIDVETGTCQWVDTSVCQARGHTQCADLADACSVFGIIGLFADTDLNGDGFYEGISVGYTMTLEPATIEGISMREVQSTDRVLKRAE